MYRAYVEKTILLETKDYYRYDGVLLKGVKTSIKLYLQLKFQFFDQDLHVVFSYFTRDQD